MNFVDDVHLVSAVNRWKLYLFPDITGILYAVVAGCVHFDDVHINVRQSLASITHTASIAVVFLCVWAVYRACQNLGCTGFTCTPCACKQIRVANLVLQDLVTQCCDDVVLTDNVIKCLWTIFAIKCNVTHIISFFVSGHTQLGSLRNFWCGVIIKVICHLERSREI